MEEIYNQQLKKLWSTVAADPKLVLNFLSLPNHNTMYFESWKWKIYG